MRTLFFALAVVLIGSAIAMPASAEVIVFSSARSMSVAGHRVDGDRVIVTLRGGGEMTFDRTLVADIRPDEVSWIDAQGPSPASGTRVRPQLVERTAYDELIQTASARHDVDPRLVKAVIQVESSFQPRARSSKGAMGLMQLMPATARRYQARDVFDPRVNIETGARHLRTLLREFELPLALAAYNAGEAAVRRFGGIPPYSETQAYVAKILDLLQ
jgi:hypothetical protein